MLQVKKALLVAVIAASLAVCGVLDGADARQRLTGGQLRALFQGVLVGFYKETRKITVQATRAGQVIAWFEGKVDTGTWKIVGNQICVAFKVWTSGKPKCRYVERDGRWYYAVNSKGVSKIKFRR